MTTAFRRLAALLAACASAAAFAAPAAHAGFFSDAVDGAKDALAHPNQGNLGGDNISGVDTTRADGLGNQAEASVKRANALLDDGLKHDSMVGGANTSQTAGVQGGKNLIVRIARDMKNALLAVAGFLLLIAVVRLVFSGATEEEAKKLKTTVVWATLGIVVMQSSFSFVVTLFGKDIDSTLARDFSENVFGPLTRLLEFLASFAFLAAAFYGFYKIATAAGEEEAVKQGKTVFINAALGFLALKLVKPFVYSLYGHEECDDSGLGKIFKNCELVRNVGDTVGLVGKIIQWVNGFVAVITVLLIIYAGFQVLTGAGDEEKMKKAKGTILYAGIGIVVLVSTYILFRFFVTQDVPPVPGA